MKNIFPTILIIVSIALFFLFTDGVYQDIKDINAKISNYDQALNNSRVILQKRDALAAQYKLFSAKDLDSLQKLLPDHVDNVQLILDINGIAKSQGMTLKGIKIDEGDAASSGQVIGPSNNKYSSISVSFTVTAPYQNFLYFLSDLEESLRIVDVTNLSFKSSDNGVYDYSVTIKTYWLK